MKAFLAKWFPIRGMFTGAVLLAAVGFGLNVVMFTGTAANQSKEAIVAALTPICVATANADPEYAVRIAELKAATTTKRTKIVADFGWATAPGTEKANNEVAKACAAAALAALAKAA